MPGSRRSSSPRAAALLSLSAYLLHELRYALPGGGHATGTPPDHGHGYLELLAPAVALLLCLALGSWISGLARGSDRGRGAGARTPAPRVALREHIAALDLRRPGDVGRR